MKSIFVILGFLKKEFRQIGRSREMLVVIFLLPLVQLILMGFAVSSEVKHVSLDIIDRDHSPRSRELSRAFSSTDRFSLVDAQGDGYSMLAGWQAQVVVVIPPRFGNDLNSGRKPTLQLLLDGIDGNTASIAGSYCTSIIKRFAEDTLLHTDPYILRSFTGNIQKQNLIPSMCYNPDLKSSINIIPGIIAILVTVTAMLLSALSLAREKELGTLEQLMVTPVKKRELLAGKLIPYLIIALVQMTVSFMFARVIHGTVVQGSYADVFLISGLYFFTALGLGIFISTCVSSQQQAMFFAWFALVIMILLSGFFVPIQNMPRAIKAITLLNPLRYYLSAIREIVIKGTALPMLHDELIALALTGIGCFSLGIFRFKKRQ